MLILLRRLPSDSGVAGGVLPESGAGRQFTIQINVDEAYQPSGHISICINGRTIAISPSTRCSGCSDQPAQIRSLMATEGFSSDGRSPTKRTACRCCAMTIDPARQYWSNRCN